MLTWNKNTFGLMASLSLISAGTLHPNANAGPIPYFAHPERIAGAVETQNAAFLLSEALHLIAMAHDSVLPAQRSEMRQRLATEPAIIELLDLKNQGPDASDQAIQGGLSVWLQSYPSTGAQPGTTAKVTWEPKKLLSLAHALSHVGYELAGIPRPTTAIEIAKSTVYGYHPMYQSSKIRMLRESMKSVCQSAPVALDADPKTPREYQWIRKALKYSPQFVKKFAEGYLGYNKSCETLTTDVLDLVGPHQSPLKGGATAAGQLEGLSLHLTQVFFNEGAEIEKSTLLHFLRKLARVEHLDAALSEPEAVQSALASYISPLSFVRLMSLTSHNHSLELYLQKAVLELEPDADRAVLIAHEIFMGLNHFYGLLAEHRGVRKVIAPHDVFSTASRPYHYWGGALMSCELINRGYQDWVSALVSGMLGKVYESWTTGSSGEGISDKNEDISLHIQGAQNWAPICQ